MRLCAPDTLCALLGCLVLTLLLGCDGEPGPDRKPDDLSEDLPENYVGTAECAGCHSEQNALWSQSHHAMAMAEADPTTVLGDFAGTHHETAAEAFDFRRTDDGGYAVVTTTAGAKESYPVRYTFGVAPLQQYLLAMDNGALQTLTVAWDAREPQDGGQRWFHAAPEAPEPQGDPLHWTGLAYTWNSSCADCHSIGVRKHYDAQTRSYATTFEEISVGCEACHGPGSNHVEAPAKPYQTFGGSAAAEIEVCAPCHSRRGQLAEGFKPGQAFLDYYRPALLQDPLYEADGQILDEVFVYGSFLQSRMFGKGVRCSDCHEPHRAVLRAQGNAVCVQCHSEAGNPRFPSLARQPYDTEDHHRHAADSAGAQCVNCHMRERTYMGVDGRRDHSFRVPRPDLTVAAGVPNACGDCHADRPAHQLAADIQAWFPGTAQDSPDWQSVLARVRRGDAGVEREAAAIAADGNASPIVRASLLAEFNRYRRGYSLDAIRKGIVDPDPLVRIGALAAIERLEPSVQRTLLLRAVGDDVRAVRIEAGRAATGLLRGQLLDGDRARIEAALEEYLQTQTLQADRPDAWTNRALVALDRGDGAAAERHYLHALDLQPLWIPARVNLADLYRSSGRDQAALDLLAEGRELIPDSAELAFAHGLALTRADRPEEALAAFRTARSLAPDVARFHYAFGLALAGLGRTDAALGAFGEALERFPDEIELLYAQATLQRDNGQLADARQSATRLMQLAPQDERFRALANQLMSTGDGSAKSQSN